MIKVYCRTNLDLGNERWPSSLPAVPCVGDHIVSAVKYQGGFSLTLKVCRVTWKPDSSGSWYPEIELHMTEWQESLTCRRRDTGCECEKGSITAFYEWYAPLIGRTVGSFI